MKVELFVFIGKSLNCIILAFL